MKKSKNNFLILIPFFFFLYSCGYQPLFEKDSGSANIKTVEISGNKRIAQKLANKITKSKDGDLAIFISAKKEKKVSNKSSSGKILEYSMNLNFGIVVKNIQNGEEIYNKNFSNQENYKSSNLHSDTINLEKKIIENICKIVARQILNEINIIAQK